MIQETQSKLENTNTFDKTLQCPQCRSFLKRNCLNEKEVIMSCESPICLFPLNSDNLTQFILQVDNIKQDFLKLTNFLKDHKESLSTNISCFEDTQSPKVEHNKNFYPDKLIHSLNETNWINSDEGPLYSVSEDYNYNYSGNFFGS